VALVAVLLQRHRVWRLRGGGREKRSGCPLTGRSLRSTPEKVDAEGLGVCAFRRPMGGARDDQEGEIRGGGFQCLRVSAGRLAMSRLAKCGWNVEMTDSRRGNVAVSGFRWEPKHALC
jgi:hypothetical protein